MSLMHSRHPPAALPQTAKINWREYFPRWRDYASFKGTAELSCKVLQSSFQDSWAQNYLINHSLIKICYSQKLSTVPHCPQNQVPTLWAWPSTTPQFGLNVPLLLIDHLELSCWATHESSIWPKFCSFPQPYLYFSPLLPTLYIIYSF